METSDAAANKANQSEEEPEIVTDEDKNRKITVAEALKKLDEVSNFIEVNGIDHLNMIFNGLIENVEQMKLKNQNTKRYYKFLYILKSILFTLFTRISWKNLPS